MKGISHFITGVAVGTFFPDAVQAAANGSFILVLGGIGGLLPDTLDFKYARFVEEPDILVDPHPEQFEAQKIADAIAAGIDRVGATHKKQILKCNTMRLGPDWWQQYSIKFDTQNGEVIVQLGPIVNTSQIPLPESLRDSPEGRAKIHAPLLPTYGEFTTIDIFSGPSFALEWRNGRVEIDFIPWHRQYSHSLFMALLFGTICGLLFGFTAGLVGGLAVMAHVLEDQLGYLGSNLLWPLTKVRSTGLKLIHATDAIPNFFTVGTCCMLILYNLDRFSPQPLIDPLVYWGIFWLPFPILLVYFFIQKFRADLLKRIPLLAQQEADLVAETQEVVDA
ncbi:MAG: metal-dependent hydrolase [Chloroflexi bacterium]|nr:metal-dependent hydrolase [Chloroflexota bacterium]